MNPLLAKVLSPLTLPQRIGMTRRLTTTPTRVDAYVISFGNITTGGTGKTPAVIARAEKEVATGKRVAVLTRGYGSKRTPEPRVIGPDEQDARLWQRIGDEPALIRMRVPGVWVVKSADRVSGAKAAVAAGCDTIIMDDGFQAVSLARDEDIVLVDAQNPCGNGLLVPLGPLREEPGALARATEVWLTRCEDRAAAERTARLVERHHGKAPARYTVHRPVGLVRLRDGEIVGLEALQGRRVRAMSGIAQPAAFENALLAMGARVVETLRFRDHQAFALPQTEDWVVVTEKDAVKLGRAAGEVYALRVALCDAGDQEARWGWGDG